MAYSHSSAHWQYKDTRQGCNLMQQNVVLSRCTLKVQFVRSSFIASREALPHQCLCLHMVSMLWAIDDIMSRLDAFPEGQMQK